MACGRDARAPRPPPKEIADLLFILPAMLLAVVVGSAYRLGRVATHHVAAQASAHRMPEGASHEFA